MPYSVTMLVAGFLSPRQLDIVQSTFCAGPEPHSKFWDMFQPDFWITSQVTEVTQNVSGQLSSPRCTPVSGILIFA